MLLSDFIDEINEYVDYYSLSLDGDCEESNRNLRGPNQFDKVMQLLNKIKSLNKPVKLGTVVTSQNIDSIFGIGKKIEGKVNVWKLYQFYARKDCVAEKYEKDFIIDDESFNNLMSNLKGYYSKICISPHSIDDFAKGPCVLIHPDGNVYLSQGKGDTLIGNLFDTDPKKIKELICSTDSYNHIMDNYLKTYNEEIAK